jgi:hypothetical protein
MHPAPHRHTDRLASLKLFPTSTFILRPPDHYKQLPLTRLTAAGRKFANDRAKATALPLTDGYGLSSACPAVRCAAPTAAFQPRQRPTHSLMGGTSAPAATPEASASTGAKPDLSRPADVDRPDVTHLRPTPVRTAESGAERAYGPNFRAKRPITVLRSAGRLPGHKPLVRFASPFTMIAKAAVSAYFRCPTLWRDHRCRGATVKVATPNRRV